MNRAREKPVKVGLRQSYRRVGKIALIMHQRKRPCPPV